MIKKLDILIIRAFIGPFFATFLISLFVLVMQFFWLYLDDLVGKGMDFLLVVKLVGFVAATTVPLALPLALLLSSIMTFGNLGESFELVAIKSAGIPLLRFMRPLLFVALLIAGVAFLFANNIIPVAQLKLATLKHDIIVAKPAFDIKEGVFYKQLPGFAIKVGKKEKDDSTIRNVVIYEKKYGLQDNILVAESGIMRVTADRKFLEFKLKNGWRYEEKGTNYGPTDFIRMGFQQYTKVLDLKELTINESDPNSFKYDPKMLSIRQLDITIDSLDKSSNLFEKRTKIEVTPYVQFARFGDSTWPANSTKGVTKGVQFASLIGNNDKNGIYERAISQITGVKNALNMVADDYENKMKNLRLHEIEWHRKLTLSVACIVLFLIGAPLGSIIRKGGLGTPLLFAIIFFVLFHLLNTFGEKFVKENVTSAFMGMWLSTLVLIPIGSFLTFKAMRDSQLFNGEFYFRAFRRVKALFVKKKVTPTP